MSFDKNIPQSIARYKVLSQEEEKELIFAYKKNNNPHLANKILCSNWRYVAKVAHQYSNKYQLHFSDLFQEGMIGMMRALTKFDHEKAYLYPNYRFASYFKFWIHSSMQSMVLNNWSSVRLPNTLESRKLFWGKRDPNLAEPLPIKDVSLNAQVFSDDGSNHESYEDRIAFEGPSAEEIFIEKQENTDLKKSVKEIFKKIDKRRVKILKYRFMQDETLTLNEVGDKLGVSRERARQLETRAIDQFKKMAKRKIKEIA